MGVGAAQTELLPQRPMSRRGREAAAFAASQAASAPSSQVGGSLHVTCCMPLLCLELLLWPGLAQQHLCFAMFCEITAPCVCAAGSQLNIAVRTGALSGALVC